MTETLIKLELTLVCVSLCIFLTGIILIAFNFHILGIIFYIVGHVVGSLAYSSFRRGLLDPAKKLIMPGTQQISPQDETTISL